MDKAACRDSASYAGELDQEQSAPNGYLAERDCGLYGHHLEAPTANGHLHPLRGDPMLPPHFNRSCASPLQLESQPSDGHLCDLRPG